jgi:radical SAM protein with 4Fe4S-binding SPASM domain
MDGNVQKCAFYDYNAEDESGEKLGYHNIEGVHVSERERPKFTRWWRNINGRCWNCPVIQLCQGNCPYAPEKYFRQNCKQMYYYALIGLTLSINHITGMTVKGIEFDIDHYQTIYD